MKPAMHPTPQQVRDWMRAPERKNGPPPTPAEIRRQLGWGMTATSGRTREGR